ncbi:hypothetical protein B0H13DRAFT_1867503 [Mycena leptocephala]|nr:hypothetical protein B0H13DRAFT_1867503 [Mycena leptocephala]
MTLMPIWDCFYFLKMATLPPTPSSSLAQQQLNDMYLIYLYYTNENMKSPRDKTTLCLGITGLAVRCIPLSEGQSGLIRPEKAPREGGEEESKARGKWKLQNGDWKLRQIVDPRNLCSMPQSHKSMTRSLRGHEEPTAVADAMQIGWNQMGNQAKGFFVTLLFGPHPGKQKGDKETLFLGPHLVTPHLDCISNVSDSASVQSTGSC